LAAFAAATKCEDRLDFISDMLDLSSDKFDLSSCVLMLWWPLVLDDISLEETEWCVTCQNKIEQLATWMD